MKIIRHFFFLVLLLVMVLLLTIPMEGSANWWDEYGAPKYGGTIIYRQNNLMTVFDNYNFIGAIYHFWLESMAIEDWTLDRNVFSFQTMFTPPEFMVGNLAESWEMPDAQTVTVYLRKGIHWQDKPPVNGREFTSDDVVQHYDRILGTGGGFTEPSPYYAGWISNWDRVTAIDKYTVQYKFKKPGAQALLATLEIFGLNMIEAPEWLKQGDLTNWKNAVGTGPWMPVDYVPDTSITFNRNPNYWGFDERHPENRLPYADTLKIISIPDTSTALSALRTGKIDLMNNVDWRQAKALVKSNPDLQQTTVLGIGPALELRCDHKPFTDIKVRKALQMAVDLKSIANNYYGGVVDGTPCGLISPRLTGYYFPYKDWPQELKDEYAYNPAKAKELLKEAGYPDGFKTNVVTGSNMDLQLLQAIKAYFNNIGVDMEIRTMDPHAWHAFASSGKHDQMSYYGGTGFSQPVTASIGFRYSKQTALNFTYNNDAGYDAIYEKFQSCLDPSQLASIVMEADRYSIEKHWAVNLLPSANNAVWQPHFKGYCGESLGFSIGQVFARTWVDKE